MSFDPSKYLTKVQGRDYLEVKWRLLWLRTEHPDAIITSELIAHDTERRWAQFKATVTLPSGAHAEAYGQEDAAGFKTNPGDYPEKAETKALGRALAALGMGTQFADDFDEGGTVADSPVSREQRPASAGPSLKERATAESPADLLLGEKAIKTLVDLATSKGGNLGTVCDTAQALFGDRVLRNLTHEQGRQLHQWLKEQPAEAAVTAR